MITLVLVALAAVVLAGALNFFAARSLLDDGTASKLDSIARARARSIEDGLDRFLGQLAAEAADLGVAEAADELIGAFAALEGSVEIDPDELDALEAYYRDVLARLDEAGIGPFDLDEILPAGDAARYLQYHYIVENPGDDDESRAELDDAGDGSAYSSVHARRHPFLRSVMEMIGAGELMFVSAETSEVVYSVDKRVDLGADLSQPPYDASTLADTVLEQLPRVRSGDAVFVDFNRYVPAGGDPVLFAAVAVRSDTEVVGAMVVEVPVEALNAITTASGRWEAVGLGDSGESYVVGADLLLRSESRLWIEDPEAYLDRVDDDLARVIRPLGSPVLLQTVDTEPVARALEGETFEGAARNYLGQRTLTVATPIDVAGVQWVSVSDVLLGDAREPLVDFLGRMLLVLLVVLPVAAAVGLWLARRLTAPVGPVVEAAAAVEAGARDPDLPDRGGDEFGDLARRLKKMARDLAAQEEALDAEYEQKRELLSTVLPSRLVEGEGAEIRGDDAVDVATAVAVRVEMAGAGLDGDAHESAETLARVALLADDAATAEGLDRVRASADGFLFVSGVHEARGGADAALRFARRLVDDCEAESTDEGWGVELHVGLSTGVVGTGVLRSGSLTYGAWGEPIRRSLAICALARPDEVLVDDTTTAALEEDWPLGDVDDTVGLDGAPMSLRSLVR